MGSLLLAAGSSFFCARFERSGLMHAIFRPGEKGKRHCLPNASIMIHREPNVPIAALSLVRLTAVAIHRAIRGRIRTSI